MQLQTIKEQTRGIVNNSSLSYKQRMHQLACQAEGLLDYPKLSPELKDAMARGIICDMHEGPAPHRPRYLLPDYAKALRQGSPFLELGPPKDLQEALDFLLILYTQTPSITGFPVYLGDLDVLLAPYLDQVSDEQLYTTLRRFWIMIDRLLPDAFVHVNLGPHDSSTARAVFRIERELGQVAPNITLKVDPEITPNELILDGIHTVFAVGKPHFVNHPMMVADLGREYGVVSCYNSLKIGGGSYTLSRLNLKETALSHSGDFDAFLTETLPLYVRLTLELMEARILCLVEGSRFFEHSFLVQEGLLHLSRFSAMFGIYGLAEAVEELMASRGRPGRYGHDEEANRLSYRITERVKELLQSAELPYCAGNGNHAFLHSQSGIDLDINVTAGTRVPIGTEPELHEHLLAVAPHHRLFDAGISDIFHFDDTVKRNPEAVLDILRGAFTLGMRDFTFNLTSNDFIRVTGYLVRKSDVVEFEKRGSRYQSTVLGAGSVKNQGVEKRRVKRVLNHERNPRVGEPHPAV